MECKRRRLWLHGLCEFLCSLRLQTLVLIVPLVRRQLLWTSSNYMFYPLRRNHLALLLVWNQTFFILLHAQVCVWINVDIDMVFWIRMGSDPHHFISPDRDRNPGHADTDPGWSGLVSIPTNDQVDKLYFSPETSNMLSKILKIMTPLTLTRKSNHSKRVNVVTEK